MNIQHYSPVCIPTLNRYEHFKRCLESLESCTGADKTDVYVGLDYPTSDKYVEGWKKIDVYLVEKEKSNRFKNLYVRRRNHNCGVGGQHSNSALLLREIREKSPMFIFSEDDNEFAPNFLEYINWGLQEYKNDNRILAICGFKRINCDGMRNNVYMYPRYNAWGVGMWFDRKDKLYKMADRNLFKKKIKEASVFEAFGKRAHFFASLVSMVYSNKIYGDVLPAFLPENERWCIFPAISKVRNYGHDGSGLHASNSKQYEYYTNLPIDTDSIFTPYIVEDLYNPQLTDFYMKTYSRFSRRMRLYGTIVFLTYKLTGCFLLRNKKGKWPLFWLKKVK